MKSFIKKQKLIFFSLLIVLSFTTKVLAHGNSHHTHHVKTWSLTDGSYIQGNFLYEKEGDIILQQKNGKLKHIPLASFNTQDQQLLSAKIAYIEQLNQAQHIAKSGNTTIPVEKTDTTTMMIQLSIGFTAIVLMLSMYLIRRMKNKTRVITNAGIATVSILSVGFTSSIQQVFVTDPVEMDKAFIPCKPRVTTHWDKNWFYVESNGLAAHEMMTGITAWQQQVPLPQPYFGDNAWQIPLNPEVADVPISTTNYFLRGAVGLATNGIPIFNAYNNRGEDSYAIGELDLYGGHCGRADDYHYHIAPMFLDSLTSDILPIAYAMDGFAVYATKEPDGTPMKELDEHHGHYDDNGLYHYHGTMTYPYMVGSMVGKVDTLGGQADPQPKANRIRTSLQALFGAEIVDFEMNGIYGHTLTYKLEGELYQVITAWTEDGEYTYTFIDPKGNKVVDTYNDDDPYLIHDVISSLPSAHEIELKVFPNPTSSNLTIQLHEEIEKEDIKQVMIFDMQGRKVYGSMVFNEHLSLEGFVTGQYIYTLITNKGQITETINVK